MGQQLDYYNFIKSLIWFTELGCQYTRSSSVKMRSTHMLPLRFLRSPCPFLISRISWFSWEYEYKSLIRDDARGIYEVLRIKKMINQYRLIWARDAHVHCRGTPKAMSMFKGSRRLKRRRYFTTFPYYTTVTFGRCLKISFKIELAEEYEISVFPIPTSIIVYPYFCNTHFQIRSLHLFQSPRGETPSS